MSAPATNIDLAKVKQMIEACNQGSLHVVQQLMKENPIYACQQDETTGRSPLMAAAAVGNGALCQYLLETGSAPWNAVDRQGQCAGNYATDAGHWGVVNLLVEWGTRAELILGMVERTRLQQQNGNFDANGGSTSELSRPVEHEPCTKPDYLRQRLKYTPDGRALLDSDKDAVMMEWERPLMKAHAQILMEDGADSGSSDGGKRVLNVGFGMGIIDNALQEYKPSSHIIIEAHPDVYKRMVADQWDKKPGVRICFGRWQEIMPKLKDEGVVVDAIFYDTYGEHFLDLEDFHKEMVNVLNKPGGRYSFFNGLAPDNLFFHGVACQCVKLQLGQLGLDSDFLPCEIQVKDSEWEGIRRKYWHGRDTYYLPRCTWNLQYLQTGNAPVTESAILEQARKNITPTAEGMDIEGDAKRQRME